jgi:hypothetical protein
MTVLSDDAPWLQPRWLADSIGPALAGARVLSVEAAAVGTGQMATCLRLTLRYDGPTEAPASLIVKLPASDPTSRATAGALRNYEIEVNFYRVFAPELPVRTPHCYRADYTAAGNDFILLLEDVTPAVQGDQIAGCLVDQAAIAVDELVNLHALRWGDGRLAGLEWLHRNGPDALAMVSLLIAGVFEGFLGRYQNRIDDDIVALAERLVSGLGTYLPDRPGPWTVAHGDYRLDNLLFGTGDGAPPVAVVDWQTVAYAPGVSDLSYLVGGSLTVDDRRAHERDLVRRYHERLRAAGVDLAWDDCWTQYRHYSLGGLIMAIAASMLVLQTDRGDDMFITMAQRHGRHALDLEAGDFLGLGLG